MSISCAWIPNVGLRIAEATGVELPRLYSIVCLARGVLSLTTLLRTRAREIKSDRPVAGDV